MGQIWSQIEKLIFSELAIAAGLGSSGTFHPGTLTYISMELLGGNRAVRIKNKMRTGKKANLANTEGKVYYCNLSERDIREYNQEQAVKELIHKQKGTVEDWSRPYREEYEQISNRRLTRLNKDELTREIVHTFNYSTWGFQLC